MSPVPDLSQNHEGSPLDHFSSEIPGLGFHGAGSSSEEDDASAFEFAEYQPLPQGPDQDDDAIDYSSVAGLLSALNTHGPTEISIEGSEESPEINGSVGTENSECNRSDISGAVFKEAEEQRKAALAREQASVWNSRSNCTLIEIDQGKEEEIKSVMSKITLPSSAIPSWAVELSDEEWKSQISSRIFGQQKNS